MRIIIWLLSLVTGVILALWLCNDNILTGVFLALFFEAVSLIVYTIAFALAGFKITLPAITIAKTTID